MAFLALEKTIKAMQVGRTDFSGSIIGMGNIFPNLFPFAAQITSVRHSYVIIA